MNSRDGVYLSLHLNSHVPIGAADPAHYLHMVLPRQSSGASLWRRNWTSKLLVVIGIPPIGCRTKKRYQFPGNVLGL
ncbi:hypothetical protein TNCV_2558631 [Trichonephila clavipes]|nr:hypothetical protein TNCV_2558631 [Trichonephila clavipes]